MVKACTGAENSLGALGAVVRLVATGFVALSVAGCGGSNDDGGASQGGAPQVAPPMTGSAGCNRSSALTPGAWVEQMVDVGGTARVYDVRVPNGYDASRPYRVVYQFHGCLTAREDDNPPLENVAGSDAILVRPRAVDFCWAQGSSSPDVAFFDALVPAIDRSLCTDPERRFVTGYSSGAFLSHVLACVRPDQVRAVATIAAEPPGRSCGGSVAAFLVHDRGDPSVAISKGEALRDQLAVRNRCDVSQPRQSVAPAPCEAYAGCAAGDPVVWCETSGFGHNRQDAFIVPAFWDFLRRF
jgi:polyhydroxybutyrate depolymerase